MGESSRLSCILAAALIGALATPGLHAQASTSENPGAGATAPSANIPIPATPDATAPQPGAGATAVAAPAPNAAPAPVVAPPGAAPAPPPAAAAPLPPAANATSPASDYVSDGSGDLPPLKQSNGISYRSGGAGDDEAHALLAAGRKLGLTLRFYITVQGKGAFASDVDVSIKKGGTELLAASSDGPYMIVDLPPGTYRVSATLHGQTKTQKVAIGRRDHKSLSYHWTAASED